MSVAHLAWLAGSFVLLSCALLAAVEGANLTRAQAKWVHQVARGEIPEAWPAMTAQQVGSLSVAGFHQCSLSALSSAQERAHTPLRLLSLPALPEVVRTYYVPHYLRSLPSTVGSL
mgnify:CR=1 FL=1